VSSIFYGMYERLLETSFLQVDKTFNLKLTVNYRLCSNEGDRIGISM